MLTEKQLRTATASELRDLRGRIFHELRRRDSEGEAPVEKPGRDLVECRKGRSGRHLQLEMVRCGKPGCKKDQAGGHGPYWYLYLPNARTGRQTSKYVGKNLPDDLAREFGVEAEDEVRVEAPAGGGG